MASSESAPPAALWRSSCTSLGENPYTEGTARFIEYFGKKLASGEKLLELYQELSTARGYPFHHVDNLGSALHWATDTRDPVDSCHEYKNPVPDAIENFREAMEHFGLPPYDDYQILDLSKTTYQGAERVTAWVQDNQSLKNSLTLCEFFSLATSFCDPPSMDLSEPTIDQILFVSIHFASDQKAGLPTDIDEPMISAGRLKYKRPMTAKTAKTASKNYDYYMCKYWFFGERHPQLEGWRRTVGSKFSENLEGSETFVVPLYNVASSENLKELVIEPLLTVVEKQEKDV